MHYVRVFSRPSWVSKWHEARPHAPTLLNCFDVSNAKAKNIKPVSVYRAASLAEERENVAALFSHDHPRAERRFAVRVTLDDCDRAGIEIDQSTRGKTGVSVVDARHADLKGDGAQFLALIQQIVARMWEGEERICVFAAHAILGEVAVLANSGLTDTDALERCQDVLNKSSDMHTLASGIVRLEGELESTNPVAPVVGSRMLDRQNQGGLITHIRSLLRSLWPT